jgi:hypothetical protein
MPNVLSRDSNTITIADFYENYRLNKYNFTPPYQRLSVWTEEKQSFFIDSILKNFPVPPIFLHRHIDTATGGTKYDIIDGKQRLTSIIRFIENEIPVSSELDGGEFDEPELAGAYFSDLGRPELLDFKARFWRYVMPIEYIDTISKPIVDNIFDRLNRNGEPLEGQELRNAKYHDTEFHEMVRRLADHPFWNERLEHVDLARMEDDEFISELLFLILVNEPLAANQEIIDALYDRFTKPGADIGVEDEFCSITDFLISLNLDYEAYKIKGVSHLYGLWCFAWYCCDRQIRPGDVAGQLTNLFAELRSNAIKDDNVNEYKKSMSARTKSKSQRQSRLDALLRYCDIYEG